MDRHRDVVGLKEVAWAVVIETEIGTREVQVDHQEEGEDMIHHQEGEVRHQGVGMIEVVEEVGTEVEDMAEEGHTRGPDHHEGHVHIRDRGHYPERHREEDPEDLEPRVEEKALVTGTIGQRTVLHRGITSEEAEEEGARAIVAIAGVEAEVGTHRGDRETVVGEALQVKLSWAAQIVVSKTLRARLRKIL